MQTLLRLGMQGLIPQGMVRKVMNPTNKPDYRYPPPQGFLKFNSDRASKGNLGLAGFGVLREDNGCILFIFHCHMGRATNNMDELMALEQCIDFLKKDNLQNIIIEADFELILNSVKIICCETEPRKVSSHWRLIQVFQRTQIHLLYLCIVIFTHVRRMANKLVDILTNQGVICTKRRAKFIW